MQKISGRVAFLLAAWALLLAAPVNAKGRVALVIGNSAYQHADFLRNPRNDAQAIGEALRRLGFQVISGSDVTRSEFLRLVDQFRERSRGAEAALFFYAGHGLQVNGQNYLAPVDARLEHELALDTEVITLRRIIDLMGSEERTNLIFLDACRDNPLMQNLSRTPRTRSLEIGRGLAPVVSGLASAESRVGMMIAFATEPGNVALDGEGKHSPFAEALIRHIETPNLDIAELMRKVRREVIERTDSRQVPWDHSSLTGGFKFITAAVPVPQPPRPTGKRGGVPTAGKLPSPSARATGGRDCGALPCRSTATYPGRKVIITTTPESPFTY